MVKGKNNTTKGFVYIMTDSEHEGIVKVGRTEKHPEIRAEQLSRQTASVGEFNLHWFEEVLDCELMESYLHFLLREFHYKKEYFKIDVLLAKKISENAIFLFKELENSIKNLFIIESDIIDKRIKALEISNRFKTDNQKEILKKLESLLEQKRTVDNAKK